MSHPVRRGILAKLARRDLSVAEAARSFEETPSGITKHLHILERSGLLSRSREGRVHKLHLEPEPLKDVMDWVYKYRKFWEHRLDALDAYLLKNEGGQGK
ncbi:MAG: helix-turn-helix transcriptional regulator [Nitrospinae bacterium]|nr:helix-turn-helix transcriptional regulator [Nitrospinota bacterium]